ncbi:GNAT family N-acetyltransferase [Pseudarthrobacter psychrotolerans]|uniref:GNAT family N-acetyltransferase n=1 Tax=Pseudarthrobacter psychrotolerans TaxID=2697569 RepID=A0A6P1NN04_9MICC|nr:GNAT family protein [Pseudarthrobacter psychrotolerans]QHK21746.1 GNAT family N-acetyltransferase [Pseudarthrobacter psychrotolerans]
MVRGPFLSAHIGYWVDKEFTGRGIGSAAMTFALDFSLQELGLHRLQAATLTIAPPRRRFSNAPGSRR